MNRRLTPVAAALLAAFSAPLALAQGTPTLPALSDTQPTDAVLSDAVLSEITVHDSAKKDDFAAMKSSIGGKQATLLRDIPQSLTVINRAVLESQAATSMVEAPTHRALSRTRTRMRKV